MVFKANFAVASLSDIVQISDRAWKVEPNATPMLDSEEYHRRSRRSLLIALRRPSIYVFVNLSSVVVSLMGSKNGDRKILKYQ